MTTMDAANQDRLHELLADRATQGLPRGEQEELDRLLEAHPEVDPWALDRAAAAIDLSGIAPEPLPESVRASVENRAVAWLVETRGLRVVPAEAPPAEPASPASRAASPAPRRADRAQWWPWLAAAACLVVAFVAWWPSGSPSPAEEFERLAATAAPLPWSDVEGAGVSGEIVWDNATQTGVMRFRGLAVNDPAQLQYQLWIFDAKRGDLVTEGGDAFKAVDGGVFDVETEDGYAYVKVAAKLEVFEPELFAVTTEPPGGVVKHIDHGDYRIILAASPPDRG